MIVTLILPIFWCLYGIAGLLGFQLIPEQYKDRPWTKSYKRFRGLSWLMLGIPWLIVYFISRHTVLSWAVMVLILVAVSLPSIVCSAVMERKYKNLLRSA